MRASFSGFLVWEMWGVETPRCMNTSPLGAFRRASQQLDKNLNLMGKKSKFCLAACITSGKCHIKILPCFLSNNGRVHPKYWQTRLRQYKAAGLNTVDVYVPWNLHEPQRGVYDFGDGGSQFSPFLNLTRWVEISLNDGWRRNPC